MRRTVYYDRVVVLVTDLVEDFRQDGVPAGHPRESFWHGTQQDVRRSHIEIQGRISDVGQAGFLPVAGDARTRRTCFDRLDGAAASQATCP